MRRLSALLGAAVITLAASFTSAHAQQGRVQVGVLECRGGSSLGFIVGSVTNLSCVFNADGRQPDYYVAQIRKVGLDLGITEQTQLQWAVNAPNSRLGRGELAGSYGGVGANASIGIGGGGNFLVGGRANSVALQPISVQGQTGLNVAAGVAGLELEAVFFGNPRRHVHRHRRHG